MVIRALLAAPPAQARVDLPPVGPQVACASLRAFDPRIPEAPTHISEAREAEIDGTPTCDAPTRSIRRLCKHFAHRVPTILTDDEIVLRGEAGDAEALERLEGVIGRHLERFAAPDVLDARWTRTA